MSRTAWMAERVLEHIPAYLRRYAPEMSDELRRIDPEYEQEYRALTIYQKDDPILQAADRLEELLEDD